MPATLLVLFLLPSKLLRERTRHQAGIFLQVVAPNPHRGWSAVVKEKLAELLKFNAARDGERGGYDVRESLDLGSEQDTVTPNLWVPEADLPGFREFMGDFYEQCHSMHILLLEAVALSFSLDPQCLARQCQKDKTHNPSELRLNHYPATRAASLAAGNKTMRISPHTDFGLITLPKPPCSRVSSC
ncbi:hypothetical protein COL516b_011966 [Colletotrichum fioriniae]|nr:uncharacterized protein COL516b_011966 [Colletotrichum fioriniae]KAJ0296112.1 hypothetical protein COL516b_011966 [Colletotrichum fioriniae]